MARDRSDRVIGRFIGPYRIAFLRPRQHEVEIARLALIGAIAAVCGRGEHRHVDILARYILHRRIVGFAQGQGIVAVGDHPVADPHHDAARTGDDVDRVVGARYPFHALGHMTSPSPARWGLSARRASGASGHGSGPPYYESMVSA